MKQQCNLNNALQRGIAFYWFLATLSVIVALHSTPSQAQPFAYVTNPLAGTVSVIDTNPSGLDFNKVISTIQTGEDPNVIAFVPDGTRIYVANHDSGTVSVIDTNPNSKDFNNVVSLIQVGVSPDVIVITPDGSRAYVTSHSSASVTVIDTNPGSTAFNTVVSTINLSDLPDNMAITPDGSRAYVTSRPSASVTVIDTDPGSTNFNRVLLTIRVGGDPDTIAFTQDGSFAYLLSPLTHSISVMDTNPSSPSYNQVVSAIGPCSFPSDIAFTPDGSRAYMTNRDAGTVSMIGTNPASSDFNKVLAVINVGPNPEVIAITPDGSLIYVIADRRSVVVIDTSDNAVLDTLAMNSGSYWAAIVPAVDGNSNIVALKIHRARLKLHRKANRDRFKVKGSFELETMIDEIDFQNKNVTVTLGDYSETIAGSEFVREDDKFQYKSRSGGITEIKIRDDGRFTVKAKRLELSGLNLDGRVNSVNFYLQIGDYSGETEIQFDRKGRYHYRRGRKGRAR